MRRSKIVCKRSIREACRNMKVLAVCILKLVLLTSVECRDLTQSNKKPSITRETVDDSSGVVRVVLRYPLTQPETFIVGPNHTTLVLCRARVQSPESLRIKCKGVRSRESLHRITTLVEHVKYGPVTTARLILRRTDVKKHHLNAVSCFCEVNKVERSHKAIISFNDASSLPDTGLFEPRKYRRLSVDRNKPVKFGWRFVNSSAIQCYHDGEPTLNIRIDVKGVVEVFINKTSHGDAGIYSCRADTSDLGSHLSSLVELHVLEGWSEWYIWRPCSTRCGIGKMVKRRRCLNSGDMKCKGPSVRREMCETRCADVKPKFLQEPSDTHVQPGTPVILSCTATYSYKFQLRFRCFKIHGLFIRDTARVNISMHSIFGANAKYKMLKLRLLGPKEHDKYMGVACHCEAVAWGVLVTSRSAKVFFGNKTHSLTKQSNQTSLTTRLHPTDPYISLGKDAYPTIHLRWSKAKIYTPGQNGPIFIGDNSTGMDTNENNIRGSKEPGSLVVSQNVVILACVVGALFVMVTAVMSVMYKEKSKSRRQQRNAGTGHATTSVEHQSDGQDNTRQGTPRDSSYRDSCNVTVDLLCVPLFGTKVREIRQGNSDAPQPFTSDYRENTASSDSAKCHNTVEEIPRCSVDGDTSSSSPLYDNNGDLCMDQCELQRQGSAKSQKSTLSALSCMSKKRQVSSGSTERETNSSMLSVDTHREAEDVFPDENEHEAEDVFPDGTDWHRQGSKKSQTSTFSAMSSISKTSCPRPKLPHTADPRFCAWGRIDHKGGCLTIERTGISLYIPSMALPQGIVEDIFIALMNEKGQYPDLRPGQAVLSPVVICGPDGLKFEKHVHLTVPHNAVLGEEAWKLQGKSCPTEVTDAERNGWKTMNDDDCTSEPFSYIDDKSCKLMIKHFSDHAVVGEPVKGKEAIAQVKVKVVPFSTPPTACSDCSVRIYCLAATEAALEVVSQNEQRVNGIQTDSSKLLFVNNTGRDVHVKAVPKMEGWDTVTDTEKHIPFRDIWEGIKTSPNVSFAFARSQPTVFNFRYTFEVKQREESSSVEVLVLHSIKHPSTMSSGYDSSDGGHRIIREPQMPSWARRELRILLEPDEGPCIKNWKALAEELGCHPQYIRYLDKGKAQAPTDELFEWWETQMSDKVPLRKMAELLHRMERGDAARVVESIYSTEV